MMVALLVILTVLICCGLERLRHRRVRWVECDPEAFNE